MRWALVAVLLCLAVGVAGCGDGDSGDTTSKPIPSQSRAEALRRSAPKVTVPDHVPPEKLTVVNLIEGEGRSAEPGDELAVHYNSAYITGRHFETYWDTPFRFELGADRVIPGWETGLVGMRVGGRRKLIIRPPLTSQVYVGKDPEETLIYVIDLLAVNP